MGPVNARAVQDVRKKHGEERRDERLGRFVKKRAPTRQHVKMFNQVGAPPTHVEERAYPKLIEQEDDVERYGDLKFKIDESIFAACKKPK